MDKHPIKPVLEHYGLQTFEDHRTGWVKVKCPFHDDSHASAAVNFDADQFKCFACQAGGDTYKIIMDKEGMDFREAVIFAETIVGSSDNPLSKKSKTGSKLSSNKTTKAAGRNYTPPRGRRGSTSRA